MKGGCLGCVRCAFDNTCVYTDGFRPFFEKTVLPADIIIIAGPVKDRYLSAMFKQFFDRSFYRGHVPAMTGKQVGFLVSGPLLQCGTLREILSVYPAMQGANLVGMVTDESPVSGVIDARIDAFCGRSLRLAHSGYIAPAGFPVVGGHKVFRDEIWGHMRAVFRADHAWYKKNGMYDFPQNNLRDRIFTTFLSLLLSIPSVRKKADKEMKEHMVEPFARVFEESPVLKQRKKRTG
jgi:hypothetical protein